MRLPNECLCQLAMYHSEMQHTNYQIHTTPEEFENATITGHFGFVPEEYSGRGISCIIIVNVIVSKSFGFKNVFRPN